MTTTKERQSYRAYLEAELYAGLAEAERAEGDPDAWLALCKTVTKDLAAYIRHVNDDADARMVLDADGHPWLYAYEPQSYAVMKDPAPVGPDNELQSPSDRCPNTGSARALHAWVEEQIRYSSAQPLT